MWQGYIIFILQLKGPRQPANAILSHHWQVITIELIHVKICTSLLTRWVLFISFHHKICCKILLRYYTPYNFRERGNEVISTFKILDFFWLILDQVDLLKTMQNKSRKGFFILFFTNKRDHEHIFSNSTIIKRPFYF